MRLQDKATGAVWTFPEGADVLAQVAQGIAPATLSADIVPQPSTSYDWNGAGWTLNAGRHKEQTNAALLAQIADIEAEQVRPTRELLLDSANAFAKSKLAALDAQIATLRGQLIA